MPVQGEAVTKTKKKPVKPSEEKFFVISKTDGEVEECATGEEARASIKGFLENGSTEDDIEVITGRRVTFAVHEATSYTVDLVGVKP